MDGHPTGGGDGGDAVSKNDNVFVSGKQLDLDGVGDMSSAKCCGVAANGWKCPHNATLDTMHMRGMRDHCQGLWCLWV